MTISFLALLAFVGLVTDVGALYWNYGQLKRALDSAAVAASNEFRRGVTQAQMHAIALEMLSLQNVALADTTLDVFICDNNGDGLRDAEDSDGEAPWDGLPPAFYAICPDTDPNDPDAPAARKLVWIDAEQAAPVYFLHLFGVQSVNIATNSVAEAATVDVVIVIDTSESMGSETRQIDPTNANYVADCNLGIPEECRPLWDAKQAAKTLIDNLYEGYDQVGVVTFAVTANMPVGLQGDLDAAKAAVDTILLNDDHGYGDFTFFIDSDPSLCGTGGCDVSPIDSSPLDPRCTSVHPGYPDDITNPDWQTRYQYNESSPPNPINTNGEPCSEPNVIDNTVLSTCTGCGMKVAGDILKAAGRPGGVWVIVFLSDGATNLAMHSGDSFGGDINGVLSTFPNGFCGGAAGAPMWTVPFCTDGVVSTRHCGPMHPVMSSGQEGTNCPPTDLQYTVSYSPDSPAYDVEDFARDMIDRAALLRSDNPVECNSFPNQICPGTEIAIYSIFLDSGSYSAAGEEMLRYMASVGDDGYRNAATDPCRGVAEKRNCGQYYFVANASQLGAVFEDIASRIFTRITH